ncbi:hypothetical protein DNTS_028526 [Danionella cerebrum]|uniref:Uncharacterized protein n=1 Tax=Danionella cerebrum TaxID=2873325 RepID=A0A553QM69_9TELE|nr:hypothetical protein DNTS_028526 [Danionella translucida]
MIMVCPTSSLISFCRSDLSSSLVFSALSFTICCLMLSIVEEQQSARGVYLAFGCQTIIMLGFNLGDLFIWEQPHLLCTGVKLSEKTHLNKKMLKAVEGHLHPVMVCTLVSSHCPSGEDSKFCCESGGRVKVVLPWTGKLSSFNCEVKILAATAHYVTESQLTEEKLPAPMLLSANSLLESTGTSCLHLEPQYHGQVLYMCITDGKDIFPYA